jgi:hypothetical protein
MTMGRLAGFDFDELGLFKLPEFVRALLASSNLSASAAAHCARCCTGARNAGSLIFSALCRSTCASAGQARAAVSSS